MAHQYGLEVIAYNVTWLAGVGKRRKVLERQVVHDAAHCGDSVRI